MNGQIAQLLERRELHDIAAKTALDVYSVIGRVVCLLDWYRSIEGKDLTVTRVDRIVEHTGFADALLDVSWFESHDGVLQPRGYLREEWRRVRDARRAVKWRNRRKQREKESIAPPADTVTHHTDESPLLITPPEAEDRIREVDLPTADAEQGLTLEVEAQSETEKEKTKAHASEDFASTKFILPEWVPEESWREYLRMRVKKSRPLTDYGKMLTVRELDRLRRQGEDPRVVLEQSIMRGWQGVFGTRDRIGRWATPLQPVTNYDTLDYQGSATREEDLPEWIKGER